MILSVGIGQLVVLAAGRGRTCCNINNLSVSDTDERKASLDSIDVGTA